MPQTGEPEGVALEEGNQTDSVRSVSIGELLRVVGAAIQPDGRTAGLRLSGVSGLSFPHVDVIEAATEESRNERLFCLSFGTVLGPTSPCPDYFLDLVSEQMEETDEEGFALRDFLDLFDGRLTQLVLLAALKRDFYFQGKGDASDAISRLLLSLAGFADRNWIQATGLEAWEMLRYVGLFSLWPRSAMGLEGLLRDYFDGISFRIEPLCLTWCRVPDEGPADRRNALGIVNTTLSEDLILGEFIPERSHHFGVHVGPLNFQEYTDFLPSGRSCRDLVNLVRAYSPAHLSYDLNLHILGPEIPALVLAEKALPRLGYTTWLTGAGRPDDEVRFEGFDTHLNRN